MNGGSDGVMSDSWLLPLRCRTAATSGRIRVSGLGYRVSGQIISQASSRGRSLSRAWRSTIYSFLFLKPELENPYLKRRLPHLARLGSQWLFFHFLIPKPEARRPVFNPKPSSFLHYRTSALTHFFHFLSGSAPKKQLEERSLRAEPCEVWQSTIQNEITKIATLPPTLRSGLRLTAMTHGLDSAGCFFHW